MLPEPSFLAQSVPPTVRRYEPAPEARAPLEWLRVVVLAMLPAAKLIAPLVKDAVPIVAVIVLVAVAAALMVIVVPSTIEAMVVLLGIPVPEMDMPTRSTEESATVTVV